MRTGILNLLSAYLESAGCEVVAHQDGYMSYKAALTDTFDICILDVMLSNKFGIEIAEAICNSVPDLARCRGQCA